MKKKPLFALNTKPMVAFPEGEKQKVELLDAIGEWGSATVTRAVWNDSIPLIFNKLARQISAILPKSEASAWLKCLIEELPVGVELEPAYHRFMAWLLTDANYGVIRFVDKCDYVVVKMLTRAVAELHLCAAQGDNPAAEEWDDAEVAASAAARAVEDTAMAASPAVEGTAMRVEIFAANHTAWATTWAACSGHGITKTTGVDTSEIIISTLNVHSSAASAWAVVEASTAITQQIYYHALANYLIATTRREEN